jgi:hypothetical protein
MAHVIVPIILAGEMEARRASSAPLVGRGSSLILAADAPHDHPPVLLINEGAQPIDGPQPVATVSAVTGSVTIRAASPTSAAVDVGIAGTIVRVDERLIVVRTDGGERTISLPSSTRVLRDMPGGVGEIALGDTVSATKRPDGTVRSVQVHPRAMPAQERGMYPLTGADQGMIMLTGMVTGMNAGGMVVMAEGQVFPLRLLPDTRVVIAQTGAIADIAMGRWVNVRAVQQPDGVTTAAILHLTDPASPQSAGSAQRALAPSASPGSR